MNHKIRLTEERAKGILAAIRAGAFPNIAAEAMGVPADLFEKWLKMGTRDRAKEPYKTFAIQVEQAKAQARLKAEMNVFNDDPKAWLRSGPGKETPDSPGWTGIVKPMIQHDNRTVNLFTSPDFIQFISLLRTILAPYPEALAALAAAMENPNRLPPVVIPPPPTPTGSPYDPTLN